MAIAHRYLDSEHLIVPVWDGTTTGQEWAELARH
jgi:hypothetical protein